MCPKPKPQKQMSKKPSLVKEVASEENQNIMRISYTQMPTSPCHNDLLLDARLILECLVTGK